VAGTVQVVRERRLRCRAVGLGALGERDEERPLGIGQLGGLLDPLLDLPDRRHQPATDALAEALEVALDRLRDA